MENLFKGRLIIVRIVLLAATAALVALGIAAIYSAGHPAEVSPANQTAGFAKFAVFWKKQLVFAIVGIIGIIIINSFNYRLLGRLSFVLYAVILTLLAILLLDRYIDLPFVPVINSSRRWLRVGTGSTFLLMQPSEFCKVAYILALAWYLRYRSNFRSFTALIGPFGLTLLPMVLILRQPDLGTVLLMMPILFAMLFVAGAKVKHLLIIIALAVAVSPIMWFGMRGYQRARISSVLLQRPWVRQKAMENEFFKEILVGKIGNIKDWERNEGYQLTHSKFAVASGGLDGNGFRKGPYVKYNFLPERHNDFIFSIIAHQWGFLGCLGVLGLYLIIMICGLEIAWNHTDSFARLLAAGIVAMFAVEVIVNISMTIGLMPITGITLPLISYGGSSLVVNLAAIGILNNVGRSRPFTFAHKAQIRKPVLG